MRILQLLCFPLYGSGSGTYVRKLSESLVKEGHEVSIVAPDNRRVNGIEIHEVKLPFMAVFTGHPEYPDAKLYSQLSGARLNDIQNAFNQKIVEVVEDYKPDVIHVHHASNLTWVANYIKAVYQIHYVVTSHNTDVLNAVLDKRYIPLTQDALNRADVVTAVSKETRDRLLKILGKGYPKLKDKTKVVPCGVDTKFFPAEGDTSIVDRKYDIEGKRMFLYSGKITSIKGVNIFVKAAKHFPNDVFVIMGDGEERQNMEELVKKEKLVNVIFTGYLGSDDKELISALYRRAYAVIVPSTVSEGIPLSALEAMSSGRPVIASNIGGIPTAVREQKTGILMKPKSVTALVASIKTLINDPKLAEKLGEKARKDAVEKFDWSVIAEKMDKYYKICFARSKKNRASKKASFVSEEEYQEDKELVHQIQIEKGVE